MDHANRSTLPDFDVICVGCGPAGNLASYLLAQSGLSVLLLEREALPRRKVCGGGLTARALLTLPCDIGPVVHRTMDNARLAFAGHDDVQLACPGFGAMVERSELNGFMTGHAVRAGARVLPSTELLGIEQPSADRVRIRTTGGSFTARLLTGADGAGSTVRGKLFPTWRSMPAFGSEAFSQAVARARYRVPPQWMARALDRPEIRDAAVALLRGGTSYRRAFWQMPLLLVPTRWPRKARSAEMPH